MREIDLSVVSKSVKEAVIDINHNLNPDLVLSDFTL